MIDDRPQSCQAQWAAILLKKDHSMENQKKQDAACSMKELDSEGKTNLCCCYIIDEKGAYDDPCFQPVSECCSGA